MKKITWAKFCKELAKNGIVVENTPNYWKDQLHQWNCGNRDARMHDNALSTLSAIECGLV